MGESLPGKAHAKLQLTRGPEGSGAVYASGLDVFFTAGAVGVDVSLDIERIEGIHVDPEIHLLPDREFFVHRKIGLVVERSVDNGPAEEIVAGIPVTGIRREGNCVRVPRVETRAP